jgi:transcriptional regulator with XRE-family HTH domain
MAMNQMKRYKKALSARRRLLSQLNWLSFGQRILEARKEKGLTLQELANKAGTHKGYVSGIETGKLNAPAPKVIEIFCKVLGLDIDTMLVVAWAEKAPIRILPLVIERVRDGAFDRVLAKKVSENI